jgi:hypothetical protein
MAQLLSKTSGKVEEIPDADVQAAFQSGQYGFLPGAPVTVENKYGQTQQVDPSQLDDQIATGARIVAPPKPKEAPKKEEVAPTGPTQEEKDAEDMYGGAGGVTMASIFGASRGLTLGLSDYAGVELSRAIGGDEAAESARQTLEGHKTANPWASGIGEAAGALAPALVTGGGSLAATGAEGAATAAREAGTLAKVGGAILKYSPSGLVNLAAEAAERGIASAATKVLVGEAAESTLAKLVVKGIEKGAGGAVYGALGGLGSEVSEDVLGDKEITGEKLAGAMGHGALFGTMIGAGFGVGGQALSSGAKWAMTAA